MKTIYLTETGLAKFQKEQADLKEKRKEAVISLTRAREMGDLSENGFYKAARHELSSIDRRLRELEHILKYANVIKKGSSAVVSLGNTVKIKSGDKEFEYQLVGEFEANPKEGKISNESPVGMGLMGKTKGQSFSMEFDGNKTEYEVLEIK